MIKRITVLMTNGTTQEISFPKGGACACVDCDGFIVNIENRSVDTRIFTNHLGSLAKAPEVSMTVGYVDSESEYVTRTDASMYSTLNGRIMGVNKTAGYAHTEKPLATKPWRKNNYEKDDSEVNSEGGNE